MNWLRKYIVHQLLALAAMGFFAMACNSSSAQRDESAQNKETSASAARTDGLFHQQKDLVFSDSLHIRVLSWGSKEQGNYLVLMADSIQQHYVGDSFYRDGILKDAWVTDLDGDGQPEVSVVLQGTDVNRYGKLYVHELKQDFTISSVGLPQFSEALGAQYGGHDSLYLENERIVREFRIRNLADTAAAPRYRRIHYAYENKQLAETGSEDFMADTAGQ